MTKMLAVVFTLLIALAVIAIVGEINWSISNFALPPLNQTALIFIVIITDSCPHRSPMATMNSVWICVKAKTSGQLSTQSEAVLDFNVGFVTILLFAVCFILLGAGITHGGSVTFSTSSVGFAKQMIELFTKTIEGWSYWPVSAAVLSIMYSTVLTVLDCYTRFTYHTLVLLATEFHKTTSLNQTQMYRLIVVLVSTSAVTMLFLFL